MQFEVFIEPEAIEDIQLSIAWYEEQSLGLGKKFHIVLEEHLNKIVLEEHLNKISVNSFFQIRYDYVRCLPLKRYPYMIHFTVNESKHEVLIRAVFNTSLDPQKWKGRKPQ